ncbi:hypothetical protein JYU34_019327 [Plutella xylostella]|uniref:DUF5641 domain-containing protein n=1 Tax=Plutella xylostella TaxID=51655 RepID=A0ABQ7PWS9_PLUXY|nr:hypothetical protein JYU34_019327 [Plutella xylostella]
MQIEWHFNAPSWPTAGGLWEAAVKSMKKHLKRVLGPQRLTYEEFNTLLTCIEACLNSRPLVSLTENPEDTELVLTPGHFLIGEPLLAIPQDDLTDQITLRNRWQLTTKMQQSFWKRWSTEYIQSLQARSKWQNKTDNIVVGDIVVIKDETYTPGNWPIGRVTEVHPGTDGLTRVLTIKTQKGELRRPINKITRLPVYEPTEQQDDQPPAPSQLTTPDPQNIQHQKIRHPNGSGKKALIHYAFTFLTVLMLVPCTYQQETFKMTSFENQRNMYYDDMGTLSTVHDTWTVVAYYNMSSYWSGIKSIHKYVQYIENICNRFDHQNVCEAITTEFKQQLQDIEHNNFILQGVSSTPRIRTKRGYFDGVGRVANSLFGVLDDRFAQQYQQDIEHVKVNEQHLLTMLKNHTSILEVHNNIILRNEESINKQLHLLKEHSFQTNEYLRNMQIRAEETAMMTYFNSISISVNIIINKLRRMQEDVLETLQDIHQGHLDTRVLSADQLKRELREISSQIPKYLSLPMDDMYSDITELYKAIRVKAALTTNSLILEVQIPLIHNDQFQIYRVIPIPLISGSLARTAITTTEYLAINIIKDTYIQLTNEEIRQCIAMGQNRYLCKINKPIHNMHQHNDPCEIAVLAKNNLPKCTFRTSTCSNEWIELKSKNSWIYVCCGTCRITIICQKHMTSRVINTTGIIGLQQGCTIKRDEATIYTENSYRSSININNKIALPTLSDINNMTILPVQDTDNTTESHYNALMQLKQQIWELKNKSEFPAQITDHDIHQYAATYSTLGLVLMLFIITGTLKCIKERCGSRQGQQQYPVGMETMTPTQRPPLVAQPAHAPPPPPPPQPLPQATTDRTPQSGSQIEKTKKILFNV